MTIEGAQNKKKPFRKITKVRLRNIGLYYLERFESSVQNLREVLKRRVDKYAFENKDFNKAEAYQWIEEVLAEFEKLNYVNDERYAELKVKDYLAAGKPARYIKIKPKAKGIDEKTAQTLLEKQDYDAKTMALRFAKKKKIGPYRFDEAKQKELRQKDMGTLLRAGFDYEIVCDILSQNFEQEEDK
jgi:regulatory protein